MNHWTRFALGAVCACCLLIAGASSAFALSPTNAPLAGSNFQGGDGNEANPAGDVSTPPDGVNDIDWQALAATIPTTIDDNAVDSMFEGGDKESQPGAWGIATKAGGVTPSKDNLLAAWSTSSPNVSGPPNTYLDLAFTREAATGNTFNTFELNQLAQTWNNGQSNIACRTTGDLLISYEVASGGSPINVDIVVYRWTSTTVDAATGCGKTGTFQAIDPAPNAEASMNNAAITNFLSPGTLGTSFAQGTFGEATLNLTGILSGANLNACENFGQISMHTRSSTSIDSQLQDYIAPVPVLVRSCSLHIAKTGSSPHHDGDSETFNYDVTNDGSVPVTVSKVSNTGVTDDKCGPVTYVSGDTNNDGKVDINETWHFTCAYTVKHSDENASHDIINTATVQGTVGNTPVTGSTTYSTQVIHPAIDVTKTATESVVHVGDTIHYTVTVKNTGDTSLTVTPSDTGCTSFDNSSFTLAAGASKQLTCTHVAAAGDGASYKNQACAQGIDRIGGPNGTVSDCDNVTVTIIHPAIKVTKTAGESAVHAGDTIHYTIKVENTGDTSLTVTPSDLGCTGLTTTPFSLAAGDSTTLNCAHVATAGDGASYKNQACAQGVDSIGGANGTVSDCGDVTVPILHPAIKVTKLATESAVHVGDTIHYAIKVQNTGDVDLTVTPADTGCTGLSTATFPLAAGDSTTLNCIHVATAGDGASYKNQACAQGIDTIGGTNGTVSDCDDVTVPILHPGIKVTKKADESSVHVGQTIHYTITVENTGDTDLTVTPSDLGCTSLDNSSFSLAAGDNTDLTCEHVATDGNGGSYKNEACGDGVDSIGGKVSDCGDVTTEIIHPAIKVVKSATPTTAHDGDHVTYSYDVTNQGDAPLSDLHVVDDKCDAPSYVSGDSNTDNKLDLSETWTYTCDYTVKHSDENAADHTITNTVTADGTDKLGTTVTDDDKATILVVHPGIQVTKKATESAVHVGETIHYTVTATNTGDVDLTVSPSDLGCDNFNSVDFTLAAGASKDITCTHQATDGNGGSYKNEACADGNDGFGGKVSDCGDVTTEIIHPAIKVVKTADPKVAHDSDSVAYGYTVTNEGDTPLSDVHVSDDRCSPVNATTSNGHNVGDTNGDDKLEVGEAWKYTCDYTVKHADENGSGDITNVVIADGTDKLGKTVTDDDSQTIHIVHPAISVTKKATESAVHVGETIHYTVTVTNTGDVDLTVKPSDVGCDGFPGADFSLAAGASKELTCTHQATEANGASYKNEACADGDDGHGVTVSDCGDVTTEIIHPAINVVKTGAPTSVHTGENVTFTYVVTNTGDTALKDVHIADDKCAPVTGPSGDTNSNSELDLGETWTYTCTYVAKVADENASHNIVNTVDVDGTDKLDKTVTDEDNWTTHVIRPEIHVVKSASPTTAHDGDHVTYSYDVTNPGDTPLSNVSVTDDKCAPVTYLSGDSNNDNKLDLGETWKYTCDYPVKHSDETGSGDITNMVVAAGTDDLNQTVTDDDTQTIHIVHPAIQVTKKANEPTVHVGETIHYTVTVHNTGDVDLKVKPSDLGCDNFDSADFTLAAGASTDITCTHDAAEADGASYKNEACANGDDGHGVTVSDCGDVTTEIVHPAIKVVKSATPTTVHDGDPVTYSYDVTNQGDTPLENVHVLDDKCDSPAYVSGDTNNDNKLDLGETWKYTCAYGVKHSDEDGGHQITNTVTADGTDKLGKTVTDDDKFTILVVHPGIQVTKKADQPAVHVGETIQYTITVANTGDTDLTVTPADTGCTGLDSSSFTLAAGKSKDLTCEHVATDGDRGSYKNEACADGVDSIDGKVSDCGDVTTEVIHPAIHVVKSGTPTTAHDGEHVAYSYDVTNAGDTPLSDVSVGDDKCGPVSAVESGGHNAGDTNNDDQLDLGETWKFTCDYTVAHGDENADQNVINTATASGTDKLGKTVTDDDNWTTHIVHPALAIDKTERVAGDQSYVQGPITAYVGDTIEYEINVTNRGDTPLNVTDFSDPKCDSAPGTPSGDTNSDGLLDPSETWVYHCSHVVTGDDSSPFVNTATVTAHDTHGGDDITKSDHADASVVNFKISGTKFEDLNANGQRDGGEPGIADWTIYLDANDNGQLDPGETSTKTDTNGGYEFNGLNPAGYVVREELPSGWHCSTPSPCEYKLSLKSRDPDKSAIDFGNWHDSTVAGVKFHDRNANGARDAGDEGLGGWTFYVDYNGNGAKDAGEPSAQSAADGGYKIGGIKPGSYAVREVGQSGWTCSFPASCEYDLTFRSNDAKTGADFGNWEPASVSGTKFEDTNNNGVHDAGEGPLQGFTFYVDYNGNGSLDAGEPSAVSAADGSWTISGIKPGTFDVLEVADPNYTCTYPGTGSACKYQLSLQAGDAQTGKEFGNAPPAQIVSPEKITPGTAKLAGQTGCVAKAFNARVRGTKVQSVTFVLDGKTIKRFTKTNRSGLYSVRINPKRLQIGVHRLVVSVTFQKGSGTKPKKLRLSFQRCAKKLAQPRFTG